MHKIVGASAAVSAFFLSGCSIHPETEDFSRDLVPEIVHKVQCEARAAITELIPADRQYLWKTGLGLDFDFVMTENNDASSKGGFAIPVPLGSVTIGYSVTDTNERKSSQKLATSDSFRAIADLADCGNQTSEENFRYPITGHIGLQRTFKNYFDLVAARSGTSSSLTTFEDELQFTTVIGAGVKPQVLLRAGTAREIQSDSSLSVQRTDLHRVKLVFKVPQSPEQVKFQNARDEAALLERLKVVAAEKAIPLRVQIVDKDKNVLSLGTSAGPGGGGDKKIMGIPDGQERKSEVPGKEWTFQKASPPAAPAASMPRRAGALEEEQIREETMREIERSRSRAFQERFQREFNVH